MLAAILIFGILTLWVPGRWALSGFQVAICGFAIARLSIALRKIDRRSLFFDGSIAACMGILLAAVAVWCGLQIATGWSVQTLNTQQAALDWIVNTAVFVLAVGEVRDPRRRERFLQTFLWFGAGLAVIAIFTTLTSRAGFAFWVFPVEQDVKTFGPFVYHSQYAAFVEALLPLAILRAIRDRSRTIVYAPIAVLLFASVVVAGSRTGAFLCLAEILAIPAVAYYKHLIPAQAFLRAAAGSVASIAIGILIAGWQAIWTRLQEPHPYALRANLVRSSLAMFRDRPWTGFGLGAWSVAYPRYALYDDGNFVNQAHNDWIQWAVEGGLPVFVVMLAMAILLFRPALRTIWGLGIIAVFLHCLIDYPFQQRPALAAFFFAWMAVIAVAGEITASTRATRRAGENTTQPAPFAREA